jgi:hypothetical protein
MICFSYIIVNTQLGSDKYKNDDDNNNNNKRTAKIGQENEASANHPWTASPKGRHRLLVCSQITGRNGPNAVRRSLCSRNDKNGPINRWQGRSTNTDC